MNREASNDISARSLLASGKELPRQPDAVRARVLARARVAAAAPLAPVLAVAAQPFLPRWLTMPGIAGAVAAGVIAGSFALGGRWRLHELARPPSPVSRQVQASSSVVSSSAEGPPATPVTTPAPEPQATGHAKRGALRSERAATRESYNTELELMQSARHAYAAHDFASALAAIDEHARRFPVGLLSEEREALRVRCLLAAGRTSQARAAATAFGAQFPRSVLLHPLQVEVFAHAE